MVMCACVNTLFFIGSIRNTLNLIRIKTLYPNDIIMLCGINQYMLLAQIIQHKDDHDSLL